MAEKSSHFIIGQGSATLFRLDYLIRREGPLVALEQGPFPYLVACNRHALKVGF
jgi:hypothetical protein